MQDLSNLEVAARLFLSVATGAFSLLFAFASGPDYFSLLSCSAGLAAICAIFARPLFRHPRRTIRFAVWAIAAPVALGLLLNGDRFVSVFEQRFFG